MTRQSNVEQATVQESNSGMLAAQNANSPHSLRHLNDAWPHDAQFEPGIIPPAQRRCLNCNTAMAGPYCYQCGQHEKTSLRHVGLLLRDVLHDVLNLDSRVARTLGPLMTKPGFLTEDYLSGRRQRYVPPLRMYVIASLLFFLVIGAVVKIDKNQFIDDDETGAAIAEFVTLQVDIPNIKTDPEFIALSKKLEQRDKWQADDITMFRARSMALVEKKRGKKPRMPAAPKPTPDNANKANNPFDKGVPVGSAGNTPAPRPDFHLQIGPAKPVGAPGTKRALTVDERGPIHFGDITAQSDPRLFAIQEKVNARFEALRSNPEELKNKVLSILPQSMFVLLPIFALLLKLSYPFSNRLYVEHLMVAVHSHCFLYFMLTGLILLREVADKLPAHWGALSVLDPLLVPVFVIGWIWVPLYLLLMQKRIYGQGWTMTLFKFGFVGIFYAALLALVLIIDFILGLLNG